MTQAIIDVREIDEFEAEHIEHSINVPLSGFPAHAPGILNQLKDREVIIMCRSGNRAKLAHEQMKRLGYNDKVTARVYAGGIVEWKKQGKPVIQKKKGHLSIMRQVQIVAGSAVLFSVGLSFLVDQRFAYIAGFFGAGLTFAGLSGTCALATVLAKAPWNKSVPSVKEELCQASPNSSDCCG